MGIDGNNQKTCGQVRSQPEYLLFFTRRVAMRICQNDKMPIAISRSLNALSQLREIRIGYIGQYKRDHIGAVSPQSARKIVRPVSKRRDRLTDCFAHFRCDGRIVAQHARNRSDRYASPLRNILYRRHECLSCKLLSCLSHKSREAGN
ncbi:hypothetical protein D9M70_518650 [compost metagenome]